MSTRSRLSGRLGHLLLGLALLFGQVAPAPAAGASLPATPAGQETAEALPPDPPRVMAAVPAVSATASVTPTLTATPVSATKTPTATIAASPTPTATLVAPGKVPTATVAASPTLTPTVTGPSRTATPTPTATKPAKSGRKPDKSGGLSSQPTTASLQAGATSVSYQTISSSGPLWNINIGADLSCQVSHTSDSLAEFFWPTDPTGECGTLVVANGELFAPQFYSYYPKTPYTPVSQSAVSGSGTTSDPYRLTTVVDLGSTLRLTQTDSYVVGEDSYQTDVELASLGGGVSGILYRAADCYLANSDSGYGALDASTGAVACSTIPDSTTQGRILQWQPLTPGSNYYEGYYAGTWIRIGQHLPFPNTYVARSSGGNGSYDNDAGLSWTFTVAAGPPATFSQRTRITPGLPVESPNPPPIPTATA